MIKFKFVIFFVIVIVNTYQLALADEAMPDSVHGVTGNINLEYYYFSARYYNNFNENRTAFSSTLEGFLTDYISIEGGFCITNDSMGNYFTLPILLNASIGDNHKIELGVGVDFFLGGDFQMRKTDFLIKLNYKYQPSRQALTFRFGIAEKYSDLILFFGIGYSF